MYSWILFKHNLSKLFSSSASLQLWKPYFPVASYHKVFFNYIYMNLSCYYFSTQYSFPLNEGHFLRLVILVIQPKGLDGGICHSETRVFRLLPSLNTKFKHDFSETEPTPETSCFNCTLNHGQIPRERVSFSWKADKAIQIYLLHSEF